MGAFSYYVCTEGGRGGPLKCKTQTSVNRGGGGGAGVVGGGGGGLSLQTYAYDFFLIKHLSTYFISYLHYLPDLSLVLLKYLLF